MDIDGEPSLYNPLPLDRYLCPSPPQAPTHPADTQHIMLAALRKANAIPRVCYGPFLDAFYSSFYSCFQGTLCRPETFPVDT